MHLTISAQFSFKHRPKGYRGLLGAHFRFGYRKPLSFAEMCSQIITEVSTWYCELEDPATLNHEAQELRAWLKDLVFEEVKPDVPMQPVP